MTMTADMTDLQAVRNMEAQLAAKIAAETYDLTALVSLEVTISKMLADQAATPSLFVGGHETAANPPHGRFMATYDGGVTKPVAETTTTLADRLTALRQNFDRLAR